MAARIVGRGWVVCAVMAIVAMAPLSAHDRKNAGGLSLSIGWADEPAFTGTRNAVVVTVTDAATPVVDPRASLSVEVTFGDATLTLPLEPVVGSHEWRAWLVPTRAGTYAFRVLGRIKERSVDVSTTCGEGTFHCVEDSAVLHFPAKDPSAGQLADRLERVLPRAERTSARAEYVALGAALLAVVSMAVAVLTGRRRRLA